MSATVTRASREIGMPWFDRHAIRGSREIFSYRHDMDGNAIRPRYIGCVWESASAMRAFYARGPQSNAVDAPGFVDYRDFDDWAEAERWLKAGAA